MFRDERPTLGAIIGFFALICGTSAFSASADETLACIDTVALEDADGWHACMKGFNSQCFDAAEDILDMPAQTACLQGMARAVEERAAPVIAAGAEADAPFGAYIRGAALERGFAIGSIECDFLMKTTTRPGAKEESVAYNMASCRANHWAYVYWRTLVHEKLK